MRAQRDNSDQLVLDKDGGEPAPEQNSSGEFALDQSGELALDPTGGGE